MNAGDEVKKDKKAKDDGFMFKKEKEEKKVKVELKKEEAEMPHRYKKFLKKG